MPNKEKGSDHYRNGRFVNPWYRGRVDRGPAFLKWVLGAGPEDSSATPPAGLPPYEPEVVAHENDGLHQPPNDKIQVTWIGHATFLVQVDGLNILTDPVFGKRASPVSWAGPQRKARPGVPFDALPPIDVVLISHNHYDHLERETVKRLGNDVKYFVPLGIGRWLANEGIDNVVELDWRQSAEWHGVRWHAEPVQHFSGRLPPFDSDKTLWAAWVIESPKGKIYFGGDSGYGPFFEETRKRQGAIRVALLPIGAYAPRWFMRPVHMNPPEAVQAHLDLEARTSIGMHWGTFKLTTESMAEPPAFLKKVLTERGLDDDAFVTFALGETRRYEY